MQNGLLTDTDPMPFGKYQGIKMQEVPVDYLHWMYVNRIRGGEAARVTEYIQRSLSALKKENPDLIWK